MAANVDAVGDRGIHSGASGTESRARDFGKKRDHLKLLAVTASVLAVIVVLASLATPLPIAPQHNLRTFAVAEPPPMCEPAMAYDAQSDRIILFGGVTMEGYRDKTFSYDFDTNTWTNMAPIEAPSGRQWHGMTYDSQSDRVVLCGGAVCSGYTIYSYHDTWAYDFEANSWTEMSWCYQPGGFDAGFTYDSHSDRVVRFGPSDQWDAYNDTWTYDLEADEWSDMNPAQAPIQLSMAMAYDSESDRVVMFGLLAIYPEPWMAMTWAYDLDQNTWTDMHPVQRPTKMWGPEMAYDSESDRIILFGGILDATQVSTDQTWAYDLNTNTWTYMNPATKPSARSGHAMAYDSQSDRVILFGGCVSDCGNNETWAYDFNTNTWTLLPSGQIIPEFGAAGVVLVVIATVCIFVATRRRDQEEK